MHLGGMLKLRWVDGVDFWLDLEVGVTLEGWIVVGLRNFGEPMGWILV